MERTGLLLLGHRARRLVARRLHERLADPGADHLLDLVAAAAGDSRAPPAVSDRLQIRHSSAPLDDKGHQEKDGYGYWNVPGIQHNYGCVMSFADGRAESWKWKDPYIRTATRWTAISTSPTDRDAVRVVQTVPYQYLP